MIRIFLTVLILSFVYIGSDLAAQEGADNTLWASLRLRIKPDDKTTVDIRPISRFHDNYSDYRNSSIDYSVTRKVSSVVTLGLLGRTWFLQDGSNRQFVWPFVVVGTKAGKFSLNTRFMKHWAIDVKGVPDRDFFRVKPFINYPLADNMTATAAIEPWYQFDDENRFVRMRYEFGLSYGITEHISAAILYRREEDKISPDFDMMVTTLTYKL